MDPATMMALMGLAQSAIGTKQLGAPAPAFTPGASSGVGGLLGPSSLPDSSLGSDIIGQLSGGSSPGPTVDLTNDELDPVAQNLKQSSLEDIDNPQKQNPFAGFLGGLDKGLQSPSQVLGLGLLGRMNPNLPLAGLLAMGLLNRGR